MRTTLRVTVFACATAILLAGGGRASAASTEQGLDELRNTISNLLQLMVEQGLLTRDKAQQLVRQAQDAASVKAAASAREEAGAVRVPYVPEIVKDEIGARVAEQLEPKVVDDVLQKARSERWGVPGALPDWLRTVRVYGDVLVRGQADLFESGNEQGVIKDYNAINAAGGEAKAGALNEFLNVSNNRERLRLRARLGVEASLAPDVSAGLRLSSGSLTDPGSESQTLGNYFSRDAVGFDQAYIRFDPATDRGFHYASAVFGRMANPWFAPTELIFARDLTFEGAYLAGRLGLDDRGAEQSRTFLAVGAFPIQDVALASSRGKWLVAAQLGSDLRWEGVSRLRAGAAYYDFVRVTGQQNAPGSTLLNYTAPQFVRYGNTMFDISNTTDPSVNLYALAAHFRLVNVSATYDFPVGGLMGTVNLDAVRNVAYDRRSVAALTGVPVSGSHDRGYVADVGIGDALVDQLGKWRLRMGYRYVQSDAVIDAWTDADFHAGGTNARGFYVWGELGLARDVYTRLRYLSGNEIELPKYGLDIIQLDLISRF